MLLNVSPEELIALRAAMDIALKASSGYSVRTCPQRDVIGAHWKEFTRIHARIKALEGQREMGMGKGHKEGRKYIHCGMEDATHERLHSYLLHLGNGKVRVGSLGEIAERALNEYMDRHPIVLWPGQERAKDAA
jgi:hypothetical protein